MYFDFEDHRPDTPTIGRPMSAREVVLITVNLHLVFLVLILLGPRIPFVQAILERQQEAQAEVQRQEQERQKEQARFVFMSPRLEKPVPPPARAEISDIDRRARSAERAPNPTNDMPFSRGNTTERLDGKPDPKLPPSPSASEPSAPAPAAEAPPLPVPESTERIPARAGAAAPADERAEHRHPRRCDPQRAALQHDQREVPQPAGQRQPGRSLHQLRFEGRRVRAVDRAASSRRSGATGSSRWRRCR